MRQLYHQLLNINDLWYSGNDRNEIEVSVKIPVPARFRARNRKEFIRKFEPRRCASMADNIGAVGRRFGIIRWWQQTEIYDGRWHRLTSKTMRWIIRAAPNFQLQTTGRAELQQKHWNNVAHIIVKSCSKCSFELWWSSGGKTMGLLSTTNSYLEQTWMRAGRINLFGSHFLWHKVWTWKWIGTLRLSSNPVPDPELQSHSLIWRNMTWQGFV